MTRAEKALAIYELLREAHKSIMRIWQEHPELNQQMPSGDSQYAQWEVAVDAVDNTLYLAEGYFVQKNHEENIR
jgi:hypothetical protein